MIKDTDFEIEQLNKEITALKEEISKSHTSPVKPQEKPADKPIIKPELRKNGYPF
jgi:peptidoglycan hydrolase CwlO-like protein